MQNFFRSTILRPRLKEFAVNGLWRLQLIRLRLERLFSFGSKVRIMGTACWSFPIYSQTFVYQELTQLIRNGFKVRFLYGKRNSRKEIPEQFTPLWRSRRRLIFHHSVCQRSYDYFAERVPEKIAQLIEIMCTRSGMTPEELRSQYHFWQAFAFTRLVKAYHPDYLHSYFFYEGTLFTFFASYLLDIPRGVSCYTDHMLGDYVLKLVPLHLEHCSLIIATSGRIKQELLAIDPQVDSNRILVKPNAINARQFPVVTASQPKNGQPYRLICVNRIEPKKGLRYLVEAVRLVLDRGLNVAVHLIGGIDNSPASETYAKELQTLIAELNLGEKIFLEGRKSELEIKRFFRHAHLFVAPFVETEYGDKDGIPTSLLEAMASGLPVVATDAGSILELIDAGQDGVIVPQRDVEALAMAIGELLNDFERRALVGRNAAQKVRAKFDTKVCEPLFHKRISEILSFSATKPCGVATTNCEKEASVQFGS